MITNKFCIYRKANDVIQFLRYKISNGGSIFTNLVTPQFGKLEPSNKQRHSLTPVSHCR